MDKLGFAYEKPFLLKPERLPKLLTGPYLGMVCVGEKWTVCDSTSVGDLRLLKVNSKGQCGLLAFT